MEQDQMLAVQGMQLTTEQHKAHIAIIQAVMKSIMKEGIDKDYATIPGCGPKKALLKAGAEKLLTAFRIAVDPEVENLSTPDEIRYRVKTRGTHQVTGNHVGTGIGECSSNETKYRWVEPVNDKEWDETDEHMRRLKWKKGKGGNPDYQVKQVRANPSDIANTILKMATKRSKVDLALTATGASDIFTQDLDDDEDGGEGKTSAAGSNGDKQMAFVPKNVVPGGKAASGRNFPAKIESPDGFVLSTFDTKLADLAAKAKKESFQITVSYKQTKYGLEILTMTGEGAAVATATA